MLGDMAAIMLMTLLYSARVGRFDLFKPITFLAKRITRWDEACDRRLHRLMCYLYTTQDYRMMGWIGDLPKDLSLHLFCDADFAGCPYTMRSTSGAHSDVQGPNSRFPWGAGAAGQTSVAHSTPEAELSSLDQGIRKGGETAICIWQTIMKQFHEMTHSGR